MIKEKINASAIEKQLDEPAPILVWRNGGSTFAIEKPGHLRGLNICFNERDAAVSWADTFRPGKLPRNSEPFRVVLDEYVASGLRYNGKSTALIDGNLNIIEVYR